eukprot:scaffold71964_cov29-Tisochrysis_lutea.AAC.1
MHGATRTEAAAYGRPTPEARDTRGRNAVRDYTSTQIHSTSPTQTTHTAPLQNNERCKIQPQALVGRQCRPSGEPGEARPQGQGPPRPTTQTCHARRREPDLTGIAHTLATRRHPPKEGWAAVVAVPLHKSSAVFYISMGGELAPRQVVERVTSPTVGLYGAYRPGVFTRERLCQCPEVLPKVEEFKSQMIELLAYSVERFFPVQG